MRSPITEGQPTPEDGIKAVVQDELQKGKGWLPVKIVKVNFTPSTTQVRSVDVTPLIRAVIDGEPTALVRAYDVPVAWPAAKGGASAITLPLTIGDTGRIQPAGGDISAWMVAGTEQASDMEQSTLDLSDSVFSPDLRPFLGLLGATAFSATDGVLVGPWQVGSSAAAQFVALAGLLLAELATLQVTFDAHIHPTPAGPSSVTGSPLTTAWPGDFAADKLRSE